MKTILKLILPHISKLLIICLIGYINTTVAQPTRIGQLSASCMTCHPIKLTTQNTIPSLTKRPASLTQRMLLDYRKNRRTGTIMNELSKGLSIQQIEQLSIYFSELPPQDQTPSIKPDTLQ